MRLPFDIHQFYFNASAIKAIPSQAFFIIVGIFALFMISFFFKWYRNFINTRVIEDTPTAKIRSAAQGYNELKGIQKCMPHHPTIAALSKLPCTWYRYNIQQLSRKRWYAIEQGESNEPFILEDETGTCIVDPKGAQISTTTLDTWQGFRRYPQGKPSNWFFRLIGNIFGGYRYQEWRMEDGMSVYVIGNFKTIVNKDNSTTNILSSEGLSSRSPFVISGRSQQKMLRTFKWDAFFWFISYMILLIIICWLLVARFS